MKRQRERTSPFIVNGSLLFVVNRRSVKFLIEFYRLEEFELHAEALVMVLISIFINLLRFYLTLFIPPAKCCNPR